MASSSVIKLPRRGEEKTAAPALAPPLAVLPLLTLYLTERCNSRCISCDYWRHGRVDFDVARLDPLLSSMKHLGTRVVQLSGGEPLLHPDWPALAERLRGVGLKLWLLSAGLALAKQAQAVAANFERVIVSLDGCTPDSYAAIRGVKAFDAVCEGVRALAALGSDVSLRVTVQRANYRELPRFVALARELGARGVSFLAADVANAQAFGREGGAGEPALAVPAAELPGFLETIERLERDEAQSFASGFIQESPAKLRRLHDYYAALAGLDDWPAVRCNAPDFSAVLEADGRLRPCFFIPGPVTGRDFGPGSVPLDETLNDHRMRGLRGDIAAGRRPECVRCVCSKWLDPGLQLELGESGESGAAGTAGAVAMRHASEAQP